MICINKDNKINDLFNLLLFKFILMDDKKINIFLRLWTFAIILLMVNNTKAQKNTEDVVYLKNGGIIRGIIKDSLTNRSIKIETIGKNIFVFKADEIEKISKEEIISENFVTKKKGFYNVTCMGVIVDEAFSLQTINGWKFKSRFYTGLGLSLELGSGTLFSAFADLRYDLLKSKHTPFVYLEGGYSVPTSGGGYNYYGNNSKNYGGYLSEAGIGIKINFHNSTAFLLSGGYTYRSLSYSYDDWSKNRVRVTDIYGRVNIRLGFNFN